MNRIDESKHLLADAFRRQKTDHSARKLFVAFHKKLLDSLEDAHQPYLVRTHIKGCTYLANDKKAFIYVDFRSNFSSIKFFTGHDSITGIGKGYWVRGGDNTGSERFRIVDESSASKAADLAVQAYYIASDWPS